MLVSSGVSTSSSGVIGRLFSEGYLFDFFQSVRLLEAYFGNQRSPGETVDVAEERIRFRPYNGLVFPATDIRSVDLEGEAPKRARITATFMGLYGVDSPLPVYFYDSIATDTEDSKVLRDFLDIFNHRLYALFYRSWKKYRLPTHYDRASTRNELTLRTLSLAGLGTKNAVDDSLLPAVRLSAFAGLLSSQIRSGEGLRNLVAEMLGGVEVSLLENIPRWVAIHQRVHLGRKGSLKAVLGTTACIGEEVYDTSGKFRLVLGPLRLAQYLDLLPGAAGAKLLQFLVRMYVRDYLDYDMELKLLTGEIPDFKLGDRTSRLGLTTWLGKPAARTTSRVVTYH